MCQLKYPAIQNKITGKKTEQYENPQWFKDYKIPGQNFKTQVDLIQEISKLFRMARQYKTLIHINK